MADTSSSPQMSAKAEQHIQDALSLFQGKPSKDLFTRSWSKDAIFEDPITEARGWHQYAPQWWGLAAAFSKSDTLSWRPVSETPNEISYIQKQLYKVKGIGATKEMISTVVLKLDDDGKVVRFTDKWNHNELPQNWFAYRLRRLNALTLPYLVGVPKDATAAMLPDTQGRKGKNDL